MHMLRYSDKIFRHVIKVLRVYCQMIKLRIYTHLLELCVCVSGYNKLTDQLHRGYHQYF